MSGTRLIVQIDPDTSIEVWRGWNSTDQDHVAVALVRRGLPDHHLKMTSETASEIGHYLVGLTRADG